jgi:PAS domain S-box-containing protein
MGKKLEKDRINEMVQAATKVARGDYSVQIELSGKNDEFDSLTMGINMMIDDIRTREEELQQEITERKKAEEELRREKESSEAYLNIAGVILAIIDADENISLINKKGCEVLGYQEGELIGRNWFETLLPQRIKDEIRGVFGKLMAGDTEPVEYYENPLLSKDGEERLIAFHKTVIKNPSGQIVGVLLSGEDITERKLVEEELEIQRARFRSIFDYSLEGIVTLDINNNILDVNLGFENIYGYKIEEVKAKRLDELIVPERFYYTEAKELDQMALDGFLGYETIRKRKDGTELNASISAGPVKIGGETGGRFVIFRDITNHKRAEETLEQKTRELETFINNIPHMAWLKDSDSNFIVCNQKFGDTVGMDPEYLRSHSCAVCFGEETAMKFKEDDVKVMEGRKQITFEETIVDNDGKEICLETTKSPIFNATGSVVGIVGIGVDITERKQAEEREKQLQQELNLASRLATVGEMSSGIAHEINNPLTGVMGFSQMLMKKDIPDDIRKDVDIIYEGAKRIASITERMLTFARQRKPERTSVNINDIIETTLAMRAYEMESSNIKITTQLASDIPLTFADAGQLQQVFLNIVLNAEMEMKLARGKGNLTVKTERIDNTIRLSFKDDGPGIPKKNLDRLFDPFFTTRDPDKGTGLGLSICYTIVNQHGGKIYARSKLEKGATFFVELPIVTQAEQLKMAETATEVSKTLPRARILVVDDDTIVQEFLTEMLGEEGHEVEIIENGDDALERLKSEDYDVILLDIKLPGMSGIELYEYMQNNLKSSAKKVVFITGDVMGQETMDFLSRTTAPYIPKPFDTEQLKKDIDRILSQKA